MADDHQPAPASEAASASAPAPAPAPAGPLAAVAAAEAASNPSSAPGTPAVELDPEERRMSLRVSLADKAARAAALYAQKKYEDAAEVYAQAAEMQAEMNGEMDPENAEILFLYGRALFRVGQAKSDVLGGKAAPAGGAAAEPAREKKKKNKDKEPQSAAQTQEPAATEAVAAVDEKVAEAAGAVAEQVVGAKEAQEAAVKKPLFQFTGDENFEDSDDGEGAEEGDAEDEDEDEDDLAVAFEVLDLARVLFTKRLEAAEAETTGDGGGGKGKEVADGAASASPVVRHIKERLADTHDLLAEISLENERYPNAITDSRASLKYKQELYPEESEIVAEAHFKLSLALEFASVTTSSGDEEGGGADANKPVDQDLRNEAARELEAAIASTKLKLQTKEVELATLHSPEDNEATRQQITEVKDMIADMEQRLAELQKPPLDVNAALYGDEVKQMRGLLGAAFGAGSAGESRLEEAKKTATDLTGLVRKKAKDDGAAAAQKAGHDGKLAADAAEVGAHGAAATNGKRKADEVAGGDGEVESKKAKVDEAVEA